MKFGVHLRRNCLSFMMFIIVSSVLVTIFQCKTNQNHSPLRTKCIMKILALIDRIDSSHRMKHCSPSYQFFYETRYVTNGGGGGGWDDCVSYGASGGGGGVLRAP